MNIDPEARTYSDIYELPTDSKDHATALFLEEEQQKFIKEGKIVA